MNLPPSFVFSQSSLSAYVACPRRFELRYASAQAWPAVPGEPVLERERRLELGRRFHHLVRQHLSGTLRDLPEGGAAGGDGDLRRWWRAYLACPVPGLPADRRPEVTLSMPMGSRRLQATYDLLALGEEEAVIVDWKTERRRPGREELLRRLQTRVYRYLLVEAGGTLTGTRFAPERVRMVYWFAETPGHPEILPYDAAQHDDDRRCLSGAISDIETAAAFPMTPDESACRFCVYRSLCDRGVGAGTGEEADLDEDVRGEPDTDGDPTDPAPAAGGGSS